MTRLIDADALAKFIDYGHLNNPDEKLYSENDIREMIDMMPSIDAVPVRRCKDCTYQTESWSGIKYCEAHGDHIGKDYDYCSNARRKENG